MIPAAHTPNAARRVPLGHRPLSAAAVANARTAELAKAVPTATKNGAKTTGTSPSSAPTSPTAAEIPANVTYRKNWIHVNLRRFLGSR